jgi:hypothetical protein
MGCRSRPSASQPDRLPGVSMTHHVQLDNVTHRSLRIRTEYRKGHGYDANVARVLPSELAQLQREYPLFFIKNPESGHFETIALLGFGNGENLFLAGGRWDADYVPLSIQRQPFLIGFQEQAVDGIPRQVPVVHVDMEHPSVGEIDGEPVFLPHGGESPYLERVNSILATIHQGQDASRSLSQVLVGLDLIESIAVDIGFCDGSRQSLSGLYSINEDRLRGLGGGALEALHGKGQLQAVFMMLTSLLNMKQLVARKDRLLAAQGGAA